MASDSWKDSRNTWKIIPKLGRGHPKGIFHPHTTDRTAQCFGRDKRQATHGHALGRPNKQSYIDLQKGAAQNCMITRTKEQRQFNLKAEQHDKSRNKGTIGMQAARKGAPVANCMAGRSAKI